MQRVVAGLTDIPSEQLTELSPAQRTYLIESLIQVTDPDLRRPVPLVPNAMQRHILETMEDYEITVKWRRAGLTSIYVAEAWTDIITTPGLNVELFANDDKTAKEIFQQVVLQQYHSIPERLRPRATYSTVGGLIFKDIGSRFVVKTAGASERVASNQGQGRTINRLLLTEFAYYGYPEDLMLHLEQCVPLIGGKIRIDSTPNGMNAFYGRFASARAGQSRFKARFYPWWWSDRCMLSLEPGEKADNLQGGGPITEAEESLGEGNPWATRARGANRLTLEQLKWRRWKIRDIRPLGSLTAEDRFRVEYPEDAESCFLHSGRPVFSASSLRVSTGFAEPVEGHEYVIGMDTSTGDASGHPAGIAVIDCSTDPPSQVYEWVGWEPTDSQAERIRAVHRLYNDAWMVIERNTPGDSVLTLLRRWGVQRIYKHRSKELREQTGRQRTRKPGFPMSAVTKPRIFTSLSTSLTRGELVLSGPITVADLKGMQYNDSNEIDYVSTHAIDQERGFSTHGELAIALALAWWGKTLVDDKWD